MVLEEATSTVMKQERTMRCLVTFGSKKYGKAVYLLAKSALATKSVDKVVAWNEKQLRKTSFYKENRSVLNQKQGAGYWLWRPYVILNELKKLKDGDFLIYSDANVFALSPMTRLYELCAENDGILLFSNVPQTIECWCKRDALVLMRADRPAIYKDYEISTVLSVWQKTPRVLAFLDEWLKYCCDDSVLEDMPNTQGLENHPMFVEHKHDRAVLSVLAALSGIKRHRLPLEAGEPYKNCSEFCKDDYGQLFCTYDSLGALIRKKGVLVRLAALFLTEEVRDSVFQVSEKL